MAQKNDWTDAEIGIMRTMWAAGSSASEIGIAIGRSRNAVIGKVHRLKLDGGSSVSVSNSRRAAATTARSINGILADTKRPARPMTAMAPSKPKAKKPRVTKAAPKPKQRVPATEPRSLGIALLDLKPGLHECRFPHGDVQESGGVRFCGHPVAEEGKSYCLFHDRLAHAGFANPNAGPLW